MTEQDRTQEAEPVKFGRVRVHFDHSRGAGQQNYLTELVVQSLLANRDARSGFWDTVGRSPVTSGLTCRVADRGEILFRVDLVVFARETVGDVSSEITIEPPTWARPDDIGQVIGSVVGSKSNESSALKVRSLSEDFPGEQGATAWVQIACRQLDGAETLVEKYRDWLNLLLPRLTRAFKPQLAEKDFARLGPSAGLWLLASLLGSTSDRFSPFWETVLDQGFGVEPVAANGQAALELLRIQNEWVWRRSLVGGIRFSLPAGGPTQAVSFGRTLRSGLTTRLGPLDQQYFFPLSGQSYFCWRRGCYWEEKPNTAATLNDLLSCLSGRSAVAYWQEAKLHNALVIERPKSLLLYWYKRKLGVG